MGLTLPIASALLAVYIFWGGTYLAMKFAIETLPPLLMAGTRFMIAGLMVYLWQILRAKERPTMIHWKNAAIVGGLMLLGGNGGVVWAEQLVSSGMAAIVVAAVPFWMVLLGWLWQGGNRPSVLVSLGLVLGTIGIALLVKNAGNDVANGSDQWIGTIVLIGASFAWAAGSLYSRVAKLPSAPLLAIAMQMMTGGLLCFLFGLVTGEWTKLDLAQVSMRSVLSLGYLIVFGSIIGFSAYIWLLKAAGPTLSSTYAYVNPVVAVLLGWLFAGEKMTAQDGLAAGIIVLAVAIISKANTRKLPPREPALVGTSSADAKI
jgi:drug/metabolite transporter (DMT)-like permease